MLKIFFYFEYKNKTILDHNNIDIYFYQEIDSFLSDNNKISFVIKFIILFV